MNSVGSDIVRVGTFTTESSKKAIQTACRGLGISSDTAIFISSLIPIVRGKVRSLTKTYYGDLDEGLPPVMEFIEFVKYFLKEFLVTGCLIYIHCSP